VSSNRAIRSLGTPYFSLYSSGDPDSTILPEDGIIQLSVEFALREPPPQLADPDELNPIFSIGDYFKAPPASSVAAIGVSPSGRLVAATGFGDVLESPASIIRPDNQFHTVTVQYDYGISSLVMLLDNVVVASMTSAGATPLLPTRYARAIAFNDTAGMGRCKASLRRAVLTFASTTFTDAPAVVWDFSKGYGAAIDAELVTADTAINGGFWDSVSAAASSWRLNAGYWDPLLYPKLWGEIPSLDVSSRFEWEVVTSYTKRVMPQTQYRKAVARA